MSSTLLVLLVAGLAFVTVAGLGFAFAGGDSEQTKTLKRAQALVGEGRESKTRTGTKSRAETQDQRRKQIMRTLRDQEKQQKKATLGLRAKMNQAGLADRMRPFWIGSIITGVVVLCITFLLPIPRWAPICLAFAAAFGLPRWVVGFLANRRMKKFVEVFPDAIDIITRGIKSGLPVNDCMKIIGMETPEPLAGEFRHLVENVAMGMAVDQALERMYQRMPTSEVRFFSIVLAIQQKTGGNLAEALGNLSVVIRARKMMREKIKALAGEAVASASIIGSLPPGVMAMVTMISPGYIAPLFNDHRGNLMLMIGAGWMATGVFVMRRMINFKI
ncbi:MAG: type II secretion system F family protein [Phenylobacterium sp.]